ncbi:MAG: type I DNA topoisomerase, partial [Nitrospirae bacterium]
VKKAIETPGPIDMNKVQAQQARRILDRLVGYELSPLLWKKIKRGLSAGRVQSVALKLVVDREREIEGFNPQEYWSIKGLFLTGENSSFEAKLHKYKDNLIINRSKEEFFITSEKQASVIVKELKGLNYIVSDVQKKTRKRNPPPPFITSTLQQEASRRLGFTPKKTMALAQQLYEGIELAEEGPVGLITYMRTDSTRVADEAKEAARRYITETFGQEYVGKGEAPRKKTSKQKAQDAHEAIRPTYLERPPEKVKPYLSRDHYRLYKLIWDRFIASQMAPAEIFETVYVITDPEKNAEFRATGQVIRFPGFLRLYSEEDPEQEKTLPEVKEAEPLTLKDLSAEQHFTQPPPRYTEATLVKALEEKGIGRPSTYATIISTIQERRYVVKKQGRLQPTELGVLVNDYLVQRFPELINEQFTAKMESDLDGVETGKRAWIKVVKAFYRPFKRDLEDAYTEKEKAVQDQPTELVCELCGREMVKRWGRHGWFYACSGYPDCKNTKPIETNTPPEKTDERCPLCGAEMVIRQGRYGRFLACSRYPECKGTMPLSTGVKCPEDGGDLVERVTKKGKVFWSCSNWPKCKFALWQKPLPEACPECGHPFLIEKTSRGQTVIQCPNKKCSYKRQPSEEGTETLETLTATQQATKDD